MKRIPRLPNLIQPRLTGLLLFCLAVLASGAPAIAQDRTPFDPVFAPATGAGEEIIAIPLSPQISQKFLAEHLILPSGPAKNGPSEPEIAVLTALQPEAPGIETTPKKPAASDTNPSRGGLIAGLLRLFGLGDDGGPHDVTTPDDTEEKPGKIITMAANPTQGVSPETAQSTTEQPTSNPNNESGTEQVTGLFAQFSTWLADNTENVDVPGDSRNRTPRVTIDLQPQQTATLSPSDSVIAKPVPTIARRGPEPTFMDIVSQFFTDGSVEQPSGQVTNTSQGVATGSAKRVSQAVRDSDAIPEPPELQPTPLVDAAIAEAKNQNIDLTQQSDFAVDIAVPVSDVPQISEDKLVLGAEGHLGRALPFMDNPKEHCVRRRSGRTWICQESLGWPAVIADAFKLEDVKKNRTRAIVRYDTNKATQYRVSYPTRNFDRMRFHFEYLLGPPTETDDVQVTFFAEPKQNNRVLRWIADANGNKPAAILELREIDDVRWNDFPDKEHGVARLYRDGAKPIFSMVMNADLRLIDVRNMGKTETIRYTTQP